MTRYLSLGMAKFTDRINEIAYKMPHKIEQYDSLSDLEKEHTKSIYLRNEEDKRKGVIENDKGTDGDAIVDKNVVEPIELVDKEKVMDEEMDNESNGSVNEDLTR
ncbi:hypothetical protein Tco_1540278 [Tanacetum coccineum]